MLLSYLHIIYSVRVNILSRISSGNTKILAMAKSVSEEVKALIAVIVIQISFAGMFLLTKATLDSGTKASVFVAYRQAIATLVLAPFAFFFKRKESSSPLTWRALGKIFVVSSLGLALCFNLNFAGLKYVSATLSTAMLNIIPPAVFIMAVCLRIEKVNICEWHGIAKVLGIMLGLSGAMAFTFYKGPPLYTNSTSTNQNHNYFDEKTYTRQEWIKGCFLCFIAEVFYAFWITMQSVRQLFHFAPYSGTGGDAPYFAIEGRTND